MIPELADEERELKRLQQMIKKLRDKENLLPQELEQRKREVEKQHHKLLAQDRQLAERQMEHAQNLQALAQDVNRYRERLGLELQRVGTNHMRFIFVYIDPNHPMRPFSFDLHLDSSDRYHGALSFPLQCLLLLLLPPLVHLSSDIAFFLLVHSQWRSVSRRWTVWRRWWRH